MNTDAPESERIRSDAELDILYFLPFSEIWIFFNLLEIETAADAVMPRTRMHRIFSEGEELKKICAGLNVELF